MSDEYLFVFFPLGWTNSQTKISEYHKKGKQLFVRIFTWYHCPQTRTGLRNLSRSLTTRSLFEPFPFPFQLLPCLCWVFQIEPLERDPVNIEDESMRCFPFKPRRDKGKWIISWHSVCRPIYFSLSGTYWFFLAHIFMKEILAFTKQCFVSCFALKAFNIFGLSL